MKGKGAEGSSPFWRNHPVNHPEAATPQHLASVNCYLVYVCVGGGDQ